MECPECGVQLPSKPAKCERCGHSFVRSADAPPDVFDPNWSPPESVSAGPPSRSGGSWLWILLLGGGLAYGGMHASGLLRPHVDLAAASRIVIHDIRTPDTRILAEASLDIRDIRYEKRRMTLDEFRDSPLAKRAKDAGLVTLGGQIHFPIVEVDGRLVSRENFFDAVAPLPVKAKPGEGIEVFGPNTCPYTQGAMAELRTRGLPFRFRNVNTPRWGPEFEARRAAAGMGDKTVEFPFIVIGDKVLSRPSMDDIEQAYKQGI